MKSIKPGRVPSAIGVVSSTFAAVFGVFWTIMAVKIGAPIFFPIFGVMFIMMGIVMAVYNYKNATGKNRYSAFDITEDGEETDPLQEKLFPNESMHKQNHTVVGDNNFCPYCGAVVDKGYAFCRKCGRKLP